MARRQFRSCQLASAQQASKAAKGLHTRMTAKHLPATRNVGNESHRAADRRRLSRLAVRRARGLHLWRRVKDVTTHPAFRNTARMVARLYDALHDAKRKDKLLLPTETGNGGMTHAFFKAPKTVDGSIAGRDAIAEWAKHHLRLDGPRAGLQGGVPRTLGANADFYEPYQDNAALVQVQPGARALHQPRHHPSAVDRDRPRTRSATSAATSRRRPTPASSSRAPRSSPPDRC